jgi:Polysaccharide deacetylase
VQVVALLLFLAALCIWSAHVAPAAADVAVPDYRGAVPVLLYHGIEAAPQPGDKYSVTPAEFARQVAMLAHDGFHTISIAQYEQFAAGNVAQLPTRPILITFDDGRLDSSVGADPVLAHYGMRATMFVITARAGGPTPGYLSWPQLRAMATSGRWDLQEHAHTGHKLIPTGPGRRTGPYYANLLYSNGAREKFTAFKRRVSTDILAGRELMAAQIPGFEPLSFAVPYSDYGQEHTNYAPIPAWERGWMLRTFKVFFVQDRRVYNLPGNPVGQRYGIRSNTTAEKLRDWLRHALPPSALVVSRARPKRPKVRRVRVRRRSVLIVFKLREGVRLTATRRRAGHRHRVRVTVSAAGRLRDRRLRPRTVYRYRIVAVSDAGRHSKALRIRVRTRAG